MNCEGKKKKKKKDIMQEITKIRVHWDASVLWMHCVCYNSVIVAPYYYALDTLVLCLGLSKINTVKRLSTVVLFLGFLPIADNTYV